MRLSLASTLDFPRYDGDLWAAVQHHTDRPWNDVLALWQALDIHLTHAIAHVKKEDLGRTWRYEGEDLTLGFIIEDYIAHLRHHLKMLPRPS